MTGEYRLELPYERPPAALTGNSRAHWRRRSADTRQVRETVLLLARAARIEPCEHLTVGLVWAPGDRRRRDADNLWPMLKACCDALARGPRRDWVGLELVPDDTPEHMQKLTPVILPPPAKGMWLEITCDGMSGRDVLTAQRDYVAGLVATRTHLSPSLSDRKAQ